MKLVRYGARGAERPGMVDAAGRLRDLSHLIADIGPETMALETLDMLRALDPLRLPEVPGEPRLGAPLADAPNIFCIGLNYADHAREAKLEPPSEPILFSKATSALSGPFDPIALPPGSTRTDWEVELAVVIGRPTLRVGEDAALEHVAAYCVMNDVSERDFQAERGGQWIKGKSAPSFAPIGPWLVTADAAPNPQELSLWLELNGETRQSGTTADMIFPVAELISYVSWFMELRVGDVIATGTPAGVGLGAEPARFLAPGDVVTLGIEGLGAQRQEVAAAAPET